MCSKQAHNKPTHSCICIYDVFFFFKLTPIIKIPPCSIPKGIRISRQASLRIQIPVNWTASEEVNKSAISAEQIKGEEKTPSSTFLLRVQFFESHGCHRYRVISFIASFFFIKHIPPSSQLLRAEAAKTHCSFHCSWLPLVSVARECSWGNIQASSPLNQSETGRPRGMLGCSMPPYKPHTVKFISQCLEAQ